jgi:CubicO group peptidase (beta-lactamase class C family)
MPAELARSVIALSLLHASPSPTVDPLEAAVRAGQFPRTTSVLVTRGSRTVYEGYFEGTDAETLQDPRSVGKSVTALAVGIAIGTGKIPSIDAPAFAYLKHLRPFANDGPGKQAITIGDLLTMSSALDCDDDDPKSPGNEANMYPQHTWARWAVDLPTKAGFQRQPPGRGTSIYCTAGVFLLGQILERATGEPVNRYIETRLLRPLGIERQRWRRSPSGEVMTGGMLELRTRDLGKLGRLVLDGGRWQGKQIVPRTWIDQAVSVQRRPSLPQDPKQELGYGYLFWRREYVTPCGRLAGWYMSGNGGNAVVMIKDLDAVVVVTRTRYDTRGMHVETLRLLEQQVFPKLGCAPGGPPPG